MRNLRYAIALLCVLLATAALAEDYANLVDRAEFFLGKGSAYSPDAVRALEAAAEADGEKAASDLRFVLAIGKAYLGVSRLSEAYQWMERFERAGKRDPKVDGLRDYLLKESGVGRFRITSSLPAFGVTASFAVDAKSRLDAAGKKILDRLNDFLSVPFNVDRDGVTLLVPEGQLVFTSSAPLGALGVNEKPVEIWTGEELAQRIVAAYPLPEEWEAKSGNREVVLGWPKLERPAVFKLGKTVGEGASQEIYQGPENTFTDSDVPPGEAVTYELRTYGPDGLLWAVGSVKAQSLPPVSSVRAKARFSSDLHVALEWETGPGTLDRLLVKKTEKGEEKVVLDQKGDEILRSGLILDGPLEPKAAPQVLTYKIEAVVDGVGGVASASARTTIPPEIVRIETVKATTSQDTVYVEWDTFPREGIAEGYYIYLLREPFGMGELVGTVKDAFAREFSYVPNSLEGSENWKYLIVPYSGDRFLVEPTPIEANDVLPEGDYSKRLKRLRKVPNLVLSWEPYKGTSRYLVNIEGKKEFLVRENFVELKGLQSNLKDTDSEVKVYALSRDGSKELILSVNLQFKRYGGQELQEEEKEQ